MPVANTRARYAGGVQAEYDAITGQTCFASAPIWFDDDFIGGRGSVIPTIATPGEPWVKKIVGAGPPTVGSVANASGGVIQIALAATSEKEDAVFYFGDQLTFDATKALSFETRIQLPVLPSLAGVEATFGLHSAWIDGPDNASFYARCQANGSGAINLQTKDGVTTNSVASGLVMGTTDWHIFRIDMTDPNNIGFWIDGILVYQATPFSFKATGANAILQPYFSLYKPSGTGVGSMNVDYCQCWGNRV